MRGVLLDEELWVLAVTTLIARPTVTVIDDGHIMPYASVFEWPDGSQGALIRLEEDLDTGLPTLVEMTHVASGRKVNIELPFSQYLAAYTATRGDYEAYDTIAQARAATILARRVDVLLDPNDRPTTFWVGERDTFADDGVNGFIDAGGRKFTRIIRE